jgi:predicted ATPase
MLAHDPAIAGPGALTRKADEPAGNLPASLTRFVGRQEELAQLRHLVAVSRLVTLLGPGGAGKSRLALEAASALARESPHGAWLIELAHVGDPSGVAPAMASALGVADSGEARRARASPVDALVAHLGGRSLLVVVDNCEHVIGEVAAVIETLLRAAPGLQVLATSREPLGVPGESLMPVGPLPLSDALALFADRARAVAPSSQLETEDTDLAAEVCRRLDGMPLAIELAAARLRALPLAQLAARLDDRFRVLTGGARTALPRHQTLRAVVDWSYASLFSDEQRLFSRIAVFVGPFTLDDVEAVCADIELSGADIVDLLLRLVDKSLVVSAPAGGREAHFTQLQTLWEYGRQRLKESGEVDATCARHGAYYRQMAEEAHEGLRGSTGRIWRERLTSELGNLRAALDWFIARADADAALSLASGIAWLWCINSDFVEGARWLGDALGAKGARCPELAATAKALHAYFVCGYFVGLELTPAVAVLECEEAVAALTTSDDRVRRAEALVLCATVLMRAHQFERSLDALSEAHDLLQPAVHDWQLALHDLVLAWTLALLGRFDDAEPAAHSSVERFDAHGEVWLPVDALSILALIAEARGDLDRASATHEALLERCRETGQRGFVLFSLLRLAELRGRQGDNVGADGLYEEAIACSFNPSVSADAKVGKAAVARRLGDLAGARALLDEAGDYYRDVDFRAGQAAVLTGLAWWALSADNTDDAMVFATDASRVASASGDPAITLFADTTAAAVKAFVDPTHHNVEALVALAQQRALSLPYRSLDSFTDEPDVAALAARLALTLAER